MEEEEKHSRYKEPIHRCPLCCWMAQRLGFLRTMW